MKALGFVLSKEELEALKNVTCANCRSMLGGPALVHFCVKCWAARQALEESGEEN